MGDSDGTGEWLTYDEIAAARGIKRIGAVRLVQRHRWRRQAGNDGLARVLVPPGWLAKERTTRNSAAGNGADSGGGDNAGTGEGNSAPDSVALAAFERALTALREAKDGEIASLREQLGRERDRADRTEQAVADAQARGDRAETALAAERSRLRDRLGVAERQAAEAEGLRQAEAEWRAKGLVARLRAAWRRE